ncbi:polysaccharide biosynthesis tyrosine autokinase [Photobacterium phosphoreum]|jgi:tyrosine-protein kinase Etk/Wzc|uniref:polysaccharide biosynthesis tyrosine autokinase n=1 Tax=Photobacterium phosphoreum TaxID=659 RepID=UPI001E60AE5D|nr:polysaccharide biosynthesis tyrosine autokinase [Photobacterium phosphoreum]MCD9500655.1 polysaccharide biosynthesis tyrosine autokinase [Photobacterium phosphoreum]
MTAISNKQVKPTSTANEEIDLGKIFGVLRDSKKSILAITIVFTLLGLIYSVFATPIYRSDVLIQVDSKTDGSSTFGEAMTTEFSTESSAVTEMELIKSRRVIGKAVDKLNLTTSVAPDYLPLIGKGLARLTHSQSNATVAHFTMPEDAQNNIYQLKIINVDTGEFVVTDEDNSNIKLKGFVGQAIKDQGYSLLVTALTGANNDTFTVKKLPRFDVIAYYQKSLAVAEEGKDTGIIEVSLKGQDRLKTQKILNSISESYYKMNADRAAASADKSLEFLNARLPKIKAELTSAEDKLNKYREANQSVNIEMQAKSSLDELVALNGQINELSFQEADISRSYTKENPLYKTLIEKRNDLRAQKVRLTQKIDQMPEKQREIIRLTRHVDVNQQTYMQILNKIQELDIVKASSSASVQIIDTASSSVKPVAPNRIMLVIAPAILGLILSVLIALFRVILNNTVVDPQQLKAIGLPVFALVPKTPKAKKVSKTILAEMESGDVSIEALRTLRNRILLAMNNANNNTALFTSASSSTHSGKTFVITNVAALMAEAGKRVLIIDADMRKGKIASALNGKQANGLSELLSGKNDLKAVVKTSLITNLDYISGGETSDSPAELLMHNEFKTLLAWASEHYDVVIVNSAPILSVVDASIVGAAVGTTVMVGCYGADTLKDVEQAKQKFEDNDVEVDGFVLNNVIKKTSNQEIFKKY